MKKIFAILLAVMLIASMTVTTYAVTPPLGVPDISDSVWASGLKNILSNNRK